MENLDKTMSPRSLLLEMRKKDAIKAILGVWGLDTRQHTDEMKTPPRLANIASSQPYTLDDY